MKKLLAITLAVLLCAEPAFAALVSGTPSILDQDANADPWSFNHTTVAGENALVVLCAKSIIATAFSGITFNGDAVADELTQNHSVASGLTVRGRVNPDIGTLSVSVDLAATNDGGCVAISYSGADTSDLFSNTTYDEEGGLTTLNETSITLDCPAGSEVLSIIVQNAVSTTIAPDSGQTEIADLDDGSVSWAVSSKPGEGSTTVGWTWVADRSVGHIATCVNAAAVASSFGPLRRRAQ